ncbi:MAG: DNA ligase [Colwellia sp.]
MKSLPFSLVILLLINSFEYSFAAQNNQSSLLPLKPKIQQGKRYKHPVQIDKYWVSEKLDGMRGYWDGTRLISKQGHLIPTPYWFTLNWPKLAMDGELWIKRDSFQALMSCIKTKLPLREYTLQTLPASSNSCWQEIRFMIFDLPNHTGDFSQRIEAMKEIIEQHPSDYLSMIKQFKLESNEQLHQMLEKIVANQAEGLMLHLGSSYYQQGRTSALLKVKLAQDGEAKVLSYIKGKGKYKNILGSMRVSTLDGVTFKIGSGFSDQDRRNPPAIGSIITFQYNGKTQAGIPRFARYIRPYQALSDTRQTTSDNRQSQEGSQ